jgi:GNAT superfamily N-acetyltransferase
VSLLRGQLWTRGIQAPPGLTLDVFTEAQFDALDEHARADLIEQLALDEQRVRHDWRRGDTALLAHLGSRPAGIVWAARGEASVPELGRSISLSKHEAFVHDAYVALGARGRGVAPVMLERVAQLLRETDAYRSWAIIAPDNQASLRAFQRPRTPRCATSSTPTSARSTS